MARSSADLVERENRKLERHMRMKRNLERNASAEMRRIQDELKKKSARESARAQVLAQQRLKKVALMTILGE